MGLNMTSRRLFLVTPLLLCLAGLVAAQEGGLSVQSV